MTAEQIPARDPRIERVLFELQGSIRELYPSATFEVTLGDDSPGTYLWATVDTEDTDRVLDPLVDRLLELQIDEGLPVYVIPVRTPERIEATIEAAASGRLGLGRPSAPSIERSDRATE